jgi:hypothetical protein
MESDSFKKFKEKFLKLVGLGKTDREILDEINKEEKILNSLSEVRRIKHQIVPKPKNE